MVFLISNYFQKSEKSLNVASIQSKGEVQSVKTASYNRNEMPQAQNTNAVQIPARQLNGTSVVNPAATAVTSNLNKKPSGKLPVEVSETSYLCGAATQKGTPCSRRVKGGGRCWQHEGQPAAVSPEKLLVSR